MTTPAQGLPTEGQQLFDLRRSLGFSQSQMAERMGLSLRALQEAEKSDEPLRAAYRLAAEMIALEEAVAQKNPMLAPPRVRGLVLNVFQQIFPTVPAAEHANL